MQYNIFMQNYKNQKSIIWLGASHFLCDVYGGFVNPLMPFIAAQLGFGMAIATVVLGIAQICSNMLQPIFGFFADNILKRFFVFWGLIFASIFLPLTTSAKNVPILTLCMILGCLGGSFFHPQALGFVKRFSANNNYTDNMGFFVSMGTFGFAFGPLLAASIVQFAGLNKILYTSIFGIAVALFMFKFVPRISIIDEKPKHKEFFNSFKEIISNNQMKLLLLVAMMKSIITNSSSILLPFLWRDMGYNASYIGFALFLFIFSGAFGSLLSPKLEKIIGAKTVIYISMLITCPIMILFGYIYKTHSIISLIIFGIMGFSTMLAQPVLLVKSQNTMPKYKSIVSGFINGFCWGISALLLTGLGVIAQKYGIIKVLITLSFLPVFSSYFVKYIKES